MMKDLIAGQKRKIQTLKKHYQHQVDFLDITENQMLHFMAEDQAVLKILEEVAKQKTTQIKVQQIGLF